MPELQQLRESIDAIDQRLVELLNERAGLAREIGRIKKRDGRPVYAHGRAEELLARLSSLSEGPLGEPAIRSIYTEIMSAALALEKDMVVACTGHPGGTAHFAARRQFGSSIRFEFYPDTEQVTEAILQGRADCGIVPRENSSPREGIEHLSEIEVDHGPGEAFLVLGKSEQS